MSKYFIKTSFRELIEAEEILLDANLKNPENEINKFLSKIETPLNDRSFIILFAVCCFIFLILFLRIFYLTTFKFSYYSQLALRNQIKSYSIPAERGIIYDRNSEPLVQNVPSFDLVIIPSELSKKDSDIKLLVEDLSQEISVPLEEIKNIFQKINHLSSQPILLKENFPNDLAIAFETKSEKYPGIKILISSRRDYKNAEYFSHILGYTAKVSKSDIEKYSNYSITDSIGKTGIEFQYENSLKGIDGEKQILIDAHHKKKLEQIKKEPQAGNDLILSINAGLQRKSYETLKIFLEKINLKKGAVVALNPQSGEVLALVSLPSFDNNLFSKGISFSEFQQLMQDSKRPLFNRVISGEYPPGSIIKPFLAAAALEEKIVSPKTIINDKGDIAIGNFHFRGWKALGEVNLTKALAWSSNIYFYTIGGGYGNIKGLGMEKIKYYLSRFNFGNNSGIDLPSEQNGFIPTPEWKKSVKKEQWFIGDTYNSSIGQGDVLATPLQMAVATGAIANTGTIFQPHLIKDQQPKILSQNFITKENITFARQGMREAVIYGTAKSLSDLPVSSGAKTGTAQFREDTLPHAWVITFAPFENPEIVLVVLAEEGGEGSKTAVPIAKEILKYYFQNKRAK